MYPEYNVVPIYMGLETKCARTPLIVMLSVDITPAKLVAVMFPSEVVIPVLNVTPLPL
jgi:hypothetical protein